MRVYLISFGTLFLAVYAWKDWFPAAAGLVLMMAINYNPDMPRSMLGIPGLNLWNFLLLATLPAWLVGRRREALRWDLPTAAALLLAAYVLIIGIGFVRLFVDPAPVQLDTADLVGEYFINPLKYLLPALMIFDGARNRLRWLLAVACVLGVYVFLSLLVVKWIPLSGVVSGGGEFAHRALRRLGRETGFFRTGLSVMLAGGSWAILSLRPVFRSRLVSLGLLGAASFVAFAMALTAGRGGYLAWICVGFVLSLLRWRSLAVLAPIAVALVIAVAPGVRERALEGVSSSDESSADPGGDPDSVDTETLSAGRLKVWPYVVAQIGESPLVGYGRRGYDRSGVHAKITAEVDPFFPHPHNAYLEWLLDNGWLGMAPMLVLYALVVSCSLILFTDSRHPLFVATGGLAFALVSAQLVGSWTGRYWYPNEETVGMWAAVGLMVRVWVERSRGASGAAVPGSSAGTAAAAHRATSGLAQNQAHEDAVGH
jgi:O-antigen ligase